MYSDLNIYIDLNWEDYFENDINYSKTLYNLVEFAHLHKVKLFASHMQIDSFKKNCNGFDEHFNTSPANFLDILFENTEFIDRDNNVFEICYSAKNSSLNIINNLAISAIHSNNKNLLVSISERCSQRCYLVIKSNTEFWKLDFDICNSVDMLQKWILNNTSIRNFNLSKKHGENGIGNWTDASPLNCSKEKAQEMLLNAIPDFTVRIDQLFYFDDIQKTYIEFYFEGDNPQNHWHGFHLKINDWHRVPLRVRKYFGKIK